MATLDVDQDSDDVLLPGDGLQRHSPTGAASATAVGGALATLILVAGCVGTEISYRPIAPSGRPRDPASVAIYTMPDPTPHVTIGHLIARGGAPMPRLSNLLSELRDRAALLGCDAIQIEPPYCVETPTGNPSAIAASSTEVHVACLVEGR